MVMVTREFYTSVYYGDTVPEASFCRWESMAESELHTMTRGRLKGLRSFTDEVKKGVCALMDVLYRIDEESGRCGTTEDGKGKVVKSVSSGSESISYDVQKSAYALAASDPDLRNRLCYEAVRKYLSGTGLLYWGL